MVDRLTLITFRHDMELKSNIAQDMSKSNDEVILILIRTFTKCHTYIHTYLHIYIHDKYIYVCINIEDEHGCLFDKVQNDSRHTGHRTYPFCFSFKYS
jgi:hypothetical protein